MKLPGHDFSTPHHEYAVIPRGDKNIVFTAEAVLDYDEFLQLCPQPEPPTLERPGQPAAQDPTDRGYLLSLQKWLMARNHWTALRSLAATPGLEWETIVPNDPATWSNWADELKKSKFTVTEMNLIYRAVQRANSLDDAYIDSARESFFQEQRLAKSK